MMSTKSSFIFIHCLFYFSCECIIIKKTGNSLSLVVWWLGLSVFTAVDLGSIPGLGTKILQAKRQSQKKKKRKGKKRTQWLPVQVGANWPAFYLLLCFCTISVNISSGKKADDILVILWKQFLPCRSPERTVGLPQDFQI